MAGEVHVKRCEPIHARKSVYLQPGGRREPGQKFLYVLCFGWLEVITVNFELENFRERVNSVQRTVWYGSLDG
jgi:hypothetical protein